jgi:hypothetical protein
LDSGENLEKIDGDALAADFDATCDAAGLVSSDSRGRCAPCSDPLKSQAIKH